MPTDERNTEHCLPLRIGHISDIHFGRITSPGIVNALFEDLHSTDLDLVVVSGDLTQRAFPWQYRDAAAFLTRLTIPWLAVAGNHDVLPWWRPVLRLTDPLRRYRKWISPELNPRVTWPDLAVLGINSAFGSTIQGGRIDDSERDAMSSYFSGIPESAFKILVVHHHLTRLDAFLDHDIARNAEITLQCAVDHKVDMILCGHLHKSHVVHLENIRPGHSLIVSTSGTTTSDRGRGSNAGKNFYNQITIARDHVLVVEREYDADAFAFKTGSLNRFPRSV